jgi:hypothetical protein
MGGELSFEDMCILKFIDECECFTILLCLLGLPTKAKDIVFRLIIDYIVALRDFWHLGNNRFIFT